MAYHEYGIIEDFHPLSSEYEEYAPEKYGCIRVEEDLAEPVMERLVDLPTFFHRGTRPEKGFAWCGITIVPPQSLPRFLAAVEEAKAPGLARLKQMIRTAQARGKHMIHYGL